MIDLYQGDCLEVLPKINDNTVDIIILDPPYYSTHIKELGDNNWKTNDEYIIWFKNVLFYVLPKLKNTGSMYIFHNDLSIMTDILYFLKHNCNLILRNHIKWNKFPTHNNFSRIIKTFGKNRNYSQTFTEDIYYITKQGNEIETPFSKIMKNKMSELNLKQRDISSLFLSKNGNITGWVSNKLNGTQIPTREQWEKITQLFGIQNNYDDLLYEYNTKSRYKFNQEFIEFKGKSLDIQKELLKPYSEIWEYNKDNIKSFYTAKPVDMLKNIIKISSNENDVILDPFMGSGTTGVACKRLNRDFIGIELNEQYFKIAEERIDKISECEVNREN